MHDERVPAGAEAAIFSHTFVGPSKSLPTLFPRSYVRCPRNLAPALPGRTVSDQSVADGPALIAITYQQIKTIADVWHAVSLWLFIGAGRRLRTARSVRAEQEAPTGRSVAAMPPLRHGTAPRRALTGTRRRRTVFFCAIKRSSHCPFFLLLRAFINGPYSQGITATKCRRQKHGSVAMCQVLCKYSNFSLISRVGLQNDR